MPRNFQRGIRDEESGNSFRAPHSEFRVGEIHAGETFQDVSTESATENKPLTLEFFGTLESKGEKGV